MAACLLRPTTALVAGRPAGLPSCPFPPAVTFKRVPSKWLKKAAEAGADAGEEAEPAAADSSRAGPLHYGFLASALLAFAGVCVGECCVPHALLTDGGMCPLALGTPTCGAPTLEPCRRATHPSPPRSAGRRA